MAILVFITALLAAWWIKHNIYASLFKPILLTEKEKRILEKKLDLLELSAQREGKRTHRKPPAVMKEKRLMPEPYTEKGASREISITEKELNSLISKDEEAAKRVAIDLSEDLVSIALLIPVDEEIPILNGKTIRLNCGVTLRYEMEKPVVTIRGVSIGGVPLPSAWWGNIKNTDLVQKFGEEGGFWDIFSKGIENIKVRSDHLWIKLKE